MILKKNRFVRIRVIGGSGIFDTILNIIKKPLVSKFLASAGKGAASMIGKRLAQKFIPQQQPIDFSSQPPAPTSLQPPFVPFPQQPLVPIASTQSPASTAQAPQLTIQEILDKYKGSGTTGAISIQDYIKGSGIKVI